MEQIYSPAERRIMEARQRVLAKEHAGDYNLPQMSQQPSIFGNLLNNLGDKGAGFLQSLLGYGTPNVRIAPPNQISPNVWDAATNVANRPNQINQQVTRRPDPYQLLRLEQAQRQQEK